MSFVFFSSAEDVDDGVVTAGVFFDPRVTVTVGIVPGAVVVAAGVAFDDAASLVLLEDSTSGETIAMGDGTADIFVFDAVFATIFDIVADTADGLFSDFCSLSYNDCCQSRFASSVTKISLQSGFIRLAHVSHSGNTM